MWEWGQWDGEGRQKASKASIMGRTLPRAPRGNPTGTLQEMVWTAPHSHPLPDTELPSFPIPHCFGVAPRKVTPQHYCHLATKQVPGCQRKPSGRGEERQMLSIEQLPDAGLGEGVGERRDPLCGSPPLRLPWQVSSADGLGGGQPSL